MEETCVYSLVACGRTLYVFNNMTGSQTTSLGKSDSCLRHFLISLSTNVSEYISIHLMTVDNLVGLKTFKLIAIDFLVRLSIGPYRT